MRDSERAAALALASRDAPAELLSECRVRPQCRSARQLSDEVSLCRDAGAAVDQSAEAAGQRPAPCAGDVPDGRRDVRRDRARRPRSPIRKGMFAVRLGICSLCCCRYPPKLRTPCRASASLVRARDYGLRWLRDDPAGIFLRRADPHDGRGFSSVAPAAAWRCALFRRVGKPLWCDARQ